MNRSFFYLLLMITSLLSIPGSAQQINTEIAKGYFNELKSIADKDNKKMWGKHLYGPVMFVNPETKEIVTNENDNYGSLKDVNGVYAGKLSEKDVVANTAYNWNGKIWTMIIMPLPGSDYERRVLLAHESFHSIQQDIGLIPTGGTNNHLDEKDARILLRMEWDALLKALTGNKEYNIQSALAFRELRRQKYSDAKLNENALEIMEGLAEYTGIKLGIGNETDMIKYITKKTADAGSFPSFVRSFAYISGPLYCLLLDQSNTNWRNRLNARSDLGEIVKSTYRINLGSNLSQLVESRKGQYNSGGVNKFEEKRENEKLKLVNEYKAKFISGRVLVIHFINMKIQFDPRNLIALENYGTVYPTLKIVDEWGILEVSKGALVASNWSKVTVTYPTKFDTNVLSGDGWKVTLNNGWKYVADGNNLVIKK